MHITDQKILDLLSKNARMSVADIAKHMQLSPTTVKKRINHLESRKIILGYTTQVSSTFEAYGIGAWMSIMIEGNQAREIIDILVHYPTVTSLHTTNGKWDLMVELKAKNLEEFNETLGKIRRIEGIYSTETSILLSTYLT